MNSYLKTMLLFFSLTMLFIFVGFAIAGWSGVVFALIFSVFLNLMAYWNCDKIVLTMTNAKLIETSNIEYSQIITLLHQLANNAKLPNPKLYIIEDETPNAFATGRDENHAVVALNTGIIKLLTINELSGVIAHELAHIKHKDILISTLVATLAGAISMIANLFFWVSLFGNRGDGERNPLMSLVVMLIAPIVATILQLAISRSREYAADKTGGEICKNPLFLANALNKLNNYSLQHQQQRQEQPKMQSALSALYIFNHFTNAHSDSLFSTHPNPHNRINKLVEQAKFNNHDNTELNMQDNNLNNLGETIKQHNTHDQQNQSTTTKDEYNPWI